MPRKVYVRSVEHAVAVMRNYNATAKSFDTINSIASGFKNNTVGLHNRHNLRRKFNNAVTRSLASVGVFWKQSSTVKTKSERVFGIVIYASGVVWLYILEEVWFG